ncbi:MAG: hypothetical protein LBN23_04980, partial [Paludibacter sp.]|nr:hypothetical protein [Paludibacter sp.]
MHFNPLGNGKAVRSAKAWLAGKVMTKAEKGLHAPTKAAYTSWRQTLSLFVQLSVCLPACLFV